jgi:hypothetical protein
MLILGARSGVQKRPKGAAENPYTIYDEYIPLNLTAWFIFYNHKVLLSGGLGASSRNI